MDALDYGTLTITRADGGGQQQQIVQLRRGSNKIGRSSASNLVVLDDPIIADEHALITCTDLGCYVVDLGSPGGTLLNGSPLPRPPEARVSKLLRNGDKLRIGDYLLEYHRTVRIKAEQVQPLDPALAMTRQIAGRLRYTADHVIQIQRLDDECRLSHKPSAYLQYLPPCYQCDDVLNNLLLAFEGILGPLEGMIDQLAGYFDPQLAPPALLPWLASWLDIALDEAWPEERRRALIAEAAELHRWRGTRRGLRRAIMLYTGVEPAIIEPWEAQSGANGPELPPNGFRVILNIPDRASIDETRLRRIITGEKPAHTTFELVVQATGARADQPTSPNA
ncbi:MAG: phage tail protein I [Chloroflexales bacterium]|nr:phage tail protein I [Chloroflexales bacterium]